MLNGALEGLEETLAVHEGLQAEESAVLEMTKLEAFENKSCISEVDEVRVNETAEIMADVFSEDVLTNWSEMSLDEKSAKLNEYYLRAGENLGIDTKGVIVEPMPCETPGMLSLGYNSGDGYIHLNADVLDDPSQLGQVLDTATHEMRHQFQNDALAAPNNFSDIPQEVLKAWDYEMKHYINPNYDFQGYYEQAIECDARDFAEEVLNTYTGKMNLS